MTVLVSDNFDRADSTSLGTLWYELNAGNQILSNILRITTSALTGLVSTVSCSGTRTIQFKFCEPSGVQNMTYRVWFEATTTTFVGNFIQIGDSSDTAKLNNTTNPTGGSGQKRTVDGDVVKIKVSATRVEMWVNAWYVGYWDGTFGAGTAGFYNYSSGKIWGIDDFSVYNDTADASFIIISYDEDAMKQTVGTTKKHPVAIYKPTTERITSLLNPIVYVSINGEAPTQVDNPVFSAYRATNGDFSMEIPAAMATNVGDSLNFGITTDDGEGHLYVEIDPDFSTLGLTAAQVWNNDSRTLTDPNSYKADVSGLATYADVVTISNLINGLELGATTGTGAEKIIPPLYYTLDTTARTITLANPYHLLDVEQIKMILNLSRNIKIYDCDNPKANTADPLDDTRMGIQLVSEGVFHFDYDAGMADTDKIMIVVNQA